MRLILIAIAVLAARAASVEAYPQFQLSTGTDRCTACHFSPAGGGLINDYGRDEAGSTISRGGDGRFLHGAWAPPSWLQLGLDLRGAMLVTYRDHDREVAAFPMQTDGYIRAGTERLSLAITAGLRGGARDPQPPLVERVVSREHYLMYQGDAGSYVRVGRFFPVYGIRTQDRSDPAHHGQVAKISGLTVDVVADLLHDDRAFAISEVQVPCRIGGDLVRVDDAIGVAVARGWSCRVDPAAKRVLDAQDALCDMADHRLRAR